MHFLMFSTHPDSQLLLSVAEQMQQILAAHAVLYPYGNLSSEPHPGSPSGSPSSRICHYMILRILAGTRRPPVRRLGLDLISANTTHQDMWEWDAYLGCSFAWPTICMGAVLHSFMPCCETTATATVAVAVNTSVLLLQCRTQPSSQSWRYRQSAAAAASEGACRP